MIEASKAIEQADKATFDVQLSTVLSRIDNEITKKAASGVYTTSFEVPEELRVPVRRTLQKLGYFTAPSGTAGHIFIGWNQTL